VGFLEFSTVHKYECPLVSPDQTLPVRVVIGAFFNPRIPPMNIITRVLFAATLVALPVSLVTAQEKGGKPADPKAEKQEPKKAPEFSVVQVGDKMQAVDTSKVDSMKKEHQDKFTKDMDAWKAAKKAAEDKKEKFSTPEPKATVINVVKGGFKTEAEASKFITDAEKEKAGKKDEKPKEKPKDGKEGHGK
jgi:hypothetical protein